MYLADYSWCNEEGKPIALEEWTIAEAWEYEDVIKAMQDRTNLDWYLAVFIQGGHGPDYATLDRILRVAHSRDVTTILSATGPTP